MFDTKFWNLIKEKYPKGLENLLFYLNQQNKICYRKGDRLNSLYIREKLKTICYCDIERFFETANIHFELYYNSALKSWFVKIIKIENENGYDYRKDLATIGCRYGEDGAKNKSKIKAVKKAFEILNNQLSEVK